MKDLNLQFSYQYLWADKKTKLSRTSMFSNEGKNRGDMLTLIGTYKFTKNLDGLFQLEYFMPDDFYITKAKNATFVRWQLQYNTL